MTLSANQVYRADASITITPVAGALGAELSGVDLGTDLSDEAIRTIRQALLDHCVIFFRDQDFDSDAHKRLVRRFGDIFNHPFLISEDPDVVTIVRKPGGIHIVGEDWHSDTQMVEAPPMGAILIALEVPEYGGDTLFANQYLAYEALSDGMKSMLDGLLAVNSDRLVAGPAAAERSNKRSTKARTGPGLVETRHFLSTPNPPAVPQSASGALKSFLDVL